MDRFVDQLGTYGIVLGLAAVFLLPFLLFSLTSRFGSKHMLAFAIAMFGVIIGVNLWLANRAIGTFPGLETRNSYVSSQTFDRDRSAQEQLGWLVTPEYDGTELTITITDATGQPARISNLSATIGRPTHVREDQTPSFVYENGAFRAPVQLAAGAWNIHLTAEASDGTIFRQRIDHYTGNRVN